MRIGADKQKKKKMGLIREKKRWATFSKNE